MPRFKLTIEYAGTRYSGWQIQKNARTVAGEIDQAVRRVTGRTDFELYGSGRTDAGVHAAAQVAHLDVSTSVPSDTLRRRLNDELPSDINILAARPVSHRFHARHDAVARRYVYQLARRRTAFAKNFVWWVKDPLDAAPMRAAAAALIGMRDFKSFAAEDAADQDRGSKMSAPRAKPSTMVLIEAIDIVDDGDLLLVSIEGSHFLWKMVRRVVGVLVEVGRGALKPAMVQALLDEASPAPATLTAPASGLFLEHVYYKGEARGAPARALTPLSRVD